MPLRTRRIPRESGVRCTEHGIASPELRDPCTDMFDKPGHVGPECQRKWLRNDAPSRPDPCVPWADACCFHAHQHLTVAWSRPGHGLCHECVETAEVVYANRLHDAPHCTDKVASWLHRSSECTLFLDHMKPDRRGRIYQTKVSTMPSSRREATFTSQAIPRSNGRLGLQRASCCLRSRVEGN